MAFVENDIDSEKEKKFDDVIFSFEAPLAGNKNLYANSIFLRKFKYFDSLFGNWKEHSSGKYEVKITGWSFYHFQILLKSLHTNTLPEISSIKDLVTIIKMYDMYLFFDQSKAILQRYFNDCIKKVIASETQINTSCMYILVDITFVISELMTLEIRSVKDVILNLCVLLCVCVTTYFSSAYSADILDTLDFCCSENFISLLIDKDPETFILSKLNKDSIKGGMFWIFIIAYDKLNIDTRKISYLHSGWVIDRLYDLSKKSGRKFKKRVLRFALETCTDISKYTNIVNIFEDLADPNEK
jgi:hypothetical protein